MPELQAAVIEMVEYAKQIGMTVSVALVLAASLGAVAIYAFPGATGVATSTIASTTSPCGSPGVYCGRLEIASANLTVNGNEAVLQVALLEIGNSYIGSATVYVNGTVIGVPPVSESEPPGNIRLNVQPGQQAVLVLTIPNTAISIQAGRTYSVLVQGWLGPPGQRANAGDSAIISINAS